MSEQVRVRFAPSPTGYFHVGGAWAALYNWFFARQNGGKLVLRIEDTDRERSDESWVTGITSSLEWLGILWDEGPFRQSQRRHLTDEAVTRLVAGGHLYACDCTRDEIDARAKIRGTPGYDGFCRDRDVKPAPGLALRFRVPTGGVTIVNDVIRGVVEFSHSAIEDFVVVKSNGDPLFVLANVVDDLDMNITHIIRGEEHLSTTPKAILLRQALGVEDLPVFAHLPVLVNERRQKLSKRRDRVAVEDYRDAGFLPEAMRNYLALLGWAPHDGRELMTVEEMVEEFRLEEVNRSPAFFDEKRLLHFNGLYIHTLSLEEFVARTLSYASSVDTAWSSEQFDEGAFRRLAPLIQERSATLAEAVSMADFLFAEPFEVDPDSAAKAIRKDPVAKEILAGALTEIESIPWDAASLREAIVLLGEAHSRNLAKTQAPIRVAALGRSVGLPLFESLEELGRERTLDRLREGLLLAG